MNFNIWTQNEIEESEKLYYAFLDENLAYRAREIRNDNSTYEKFLDNHLAYRRMKNNDKT